jgi:hypothetical protein
MDRDLSGLAKSGPGLKFSVGTGVFRDFLTISEILGNLNMRMMLKFSTEIYQNSVLDLKKSESRLGLRSGIPVPNSGARPEKS